jgi:rod shape-determining protein MreC
MPIQRHDRGAFSWEMLASVFRRLSLVILLAAALFILALQLSKRDRLDAIRGHVVSVLAPVLEVLGLPVDYAHTLATRLGDWVSLSDQNALLKAENARLHSVEDDVRILRAENRYLRKMLNVVPDAVEQSITARVIGDTSGVYDHALIINAGSEEGVINGMVAISDKGIVGRIANVQKHSAEVLLLTDINSRVPAITEFSRERGIATGANQDLIRMNYLPEDTRVKVGEQILTSGDAVFFPVGLGIGLVEKISDNEVWIRPFYDKQRLEYVVLVKFAPRPKG